MYRLITETSAAVAVRHFVKQRSVSVLASSDNLIETFAIPDPETRAAELDTLRRVAGRFEREPSSWYHARELRELLQRRRQHWLRPVPYRRLEQQFLKAHLERWTAIKHGIFDRPSGFRKAKTDGDAGKARVLELQRQLRQSTCDGERWVTYAHRSAPLEMPLADPDTAWRTDTFFAWFNAIVVRDPGSRDYADWLDPWLKAGAFDEASFRHLILEEATVTDLPFNCVTGLTAFNQLQTKITGGNVMDQIHAAFLLRADIFVTADVQFANALERVTVHLRPHLGAMATVALVDRRAGAMEEIGKVLR